jgi:hypothetical protein
MSPNLAMISDGKKFMWDGQPYENKPEALQSAQSYRNESFETQIVEDGGKFLVYTRRPAKDAAVAAQ